MPRITVEIDDTLPDSILEAVEEVRKLLANYLARERPSELPCLYNDLDYSGDIHEIIDTAVPFRTSEIEAAWFLHGREIEEAYETAGIGKNTRENNGMAAIYCLIESRVNEWWHAHAQEEFDAWRQS